MFSTKTSRDVGMVALAVLLVHVGLTQAHPNKGVKMFSTKTSRDVGMVPLIK